MTSVISKRTTQIMVPEKWTKPKRPGYVVSIDYISVGHHKWKASYRIISNLSSEQLLWLSVEDAVNHHEANTIIMYLNWLECLATKS